MSAHEDLSRIHEIKGSSDRTFGLTFAVFFALVGIWPLVHHHPVRVWGLAAAAVFLAAALIRAEMLRPLNRIWIRIGAAMNRVASPIVSGLVFFIAVTPLALMMRKRGKDPLRLRRDTDANSYWIHRNPPGPEPATMSNQF